MQTGTSAYNFYTLPREQVRAGVERCAFRGDGVIAVMNWIDGGNDVRPHTHEFEQVVMILAGTARYHVADQVFDCVPGTVLRVPAGQVHFIEVTGKERVLNLDLFSPVREDYLHLVAYQKEFGQGDS